MGCTGLEAAQDGLPDFDLHRLVTSFSATAQQSLYGTFNKLFVIPPLRACLAPGCLAPRDWEVVERQWDAAEELQVTPGWVVC